MNAPRILRDILPVKGPVLSPVTDDNEEITVPVMGTLPPICIITGAELPVAASSYLLEYINALPASERPVGQPGNGLAAVRLPLSGAGRIIYKLARHARLVISCLLLLAVLATSVLVSGTAWYLALIVCGSVIVGFGTQILVALDLSQQARLTSAGNVSIRGIRHSVRQKMLDWQSRHPELYPTTHP